MSIEWMAIRGSGLIAYLLLAASTIWGLLISTKALGRAVKAKPVTWFHESLAIGSLLATSIHMYFLFNHDFIDFGYRALFVPGASAWRPFAVALGVVALYSTFLITASFYVKKWIGQAAWRAIHMLSFGTFVGAALHGVLSGTDTGHPVVAGMYVATSSAVVLLLILRIARSAAPAVRPRPVRHPSPPNPAESTAGG